MTVANVTIRDVAKAAGVGVGTVSRVLNNSPAVNDATRQKVEAAIAKLSYTPSPIARRLSLGKTHTIAAIVPFFTRPAFVERLRGVEYALADSQYDLVLYNVESPARRDDYFHSIPRPERVDGMLIISLSPNDAEADYFLQTGVPLVLIDAQHSRLNRIIIDDVQGGYLATKHLIDLGHRRIACISDWLENPFNFVANRKRYQGYRQALTEANIPFHPEYHRQGKHTRQKSRELTYELLDLPEPPSAIFAVSDTQAIGVLEAARNRGLNVPRDLSVIGYDDIEIAEYLQLTTIRQPLFAFGVEGVELLLEAIESPPFSPQEVLLPVELIIRGTTTPPGS